MGIQKRVAITLILALLAIFGLSGVFTTWHSASQLQTIEQGAGAALKNGAISQAKSVFSSLQLGTRGAMVAGDMDQFGALVKDLGQMPHVEQLGLTDAKGKIVATSQEAAMGKPLDGAGFNAASASTSDTSEVLQEEGIVLVTHAVHFEPKCFDCHAGAKNGDLAGVFYVRYKLDELASSLKTMEELRSASTRSSIIAGILIGLVGLGVAGYLVFFLLGKLVKVPLVRLNHMIGELRSGHVDGRVDLVQDDEMGEMAATMNSFADNLRDEVVEPLGRLASGDLTFSVEPVDEKDALRGALKRLGIDLNRIMGDIRDSGDQIAANSGQVASASQSLAQGASEAAASLQNITFSVAKMDERARSSATDAIAANKLAHQARSSAEKGNQQMVTMVQAMAEINTSSTNISRIIRTIDEIAFQTNLLALNAAVEAARAGEHGKGFAVVAEEVRNLAARSAKAAKETEELIEGSKQKAANGATIADGASDALAAIVADISKVSDLIAGISDASEEQARGIADVNNGLRQIDQVNQSNAAAAEQSAAAASELSTQSQNLRDLLARFTLRKMGKAAVGSGHPGAGRTALPRGGHARLTR
jgi:methyl-accepting chemotaxis protein